MRVHVTLKRQVQAQPAAREAALARVLEAGGMSLGNRKRFERYGIITGDVDPDGLTRVRGLDEVEAVEVDRKRFASGA
jgi:hypothetical protein